MTSSFVQNVMFLLFIPVCTLLIAAIQQPKFNIQQAITSSHSENNSFVADKLSQLNDLSLQNMVPSFSSMNIERLNNTLIKKDLKISHQKNRIVKLQSISLILCGFTIICLLAAALMYRKHQKLITGLIKHGHVLLKDSPDLATELLISNGPNSKACLTQEKINKMLVMALQEAVNIWLKINDQSLVEFAYQSQIWTITNDSGTLRVRSLERYLSFDKIPKNPRWKNVTKSISFVLSTLSEDDHRYLKLNEIFQDVNAKLEQFYG